MMELIAQPDGITCGPACLKMVAASHGCGRGIGVLSIADICGTNPETGTDDAAVRRGLSALGLAWSERAGASPALVRDGLGRGAAFLLRMLTEGVKHWCVAAGMAGDGRVRVLDPWLGERACTDADLDRVCAPRGWQVFEVPAAQDPRAFLSMAPLGDAWDAAVALAEEAFSPVFPRDLIAGELAVADPALSRAVRVGGEVAGAYFLSERPLPDALPAAAAFDGLRPICGEGLVVAPSHRGRGIGAMLRGLPPRLGADYVWGTQLKALDNLGDWLKRRALVADTGGCWITLEAVSEEARLALEARPSSPRP
jgi:hypothetical protein